MRVAKYWAAAEVVRHNEEYGTDMAHRVWAGSDVSEDDALRLAAAKAAQLRGKRIGVSRPHAGGRTGSEDEYELYPRWTRPEPMVDDVVDAAGRRVGAVTVNGYGAHVLNTVNLVFVDIDAGGWAAVRRTGGLLRRLFGGKRDEAPSVGVDDAGAAWLGSLDSAARSALLPVVSWANEESGRGARVYRTAGGFRVMLTRPLLDPASAETHALLRSFRADPRYALLCRLQESFRARLTPKPWRVGVERFKVRYENFTRGEPALVEWAGRYFDACRGYAVCELIGSCGAADPGDPGSVRLMQMHDELCGVESGLPLA